MKTIISIVIITLMAVSTAKSTFTDPEIFERLQHFKDNGVPGTVNDIVNQAMIADGTCRLFIEQDGFVFWHNRDAVIKVINAIKNLPATSHPSNLVLNDLVDIGKAVSFSGFIAIPLILFLQHNFKRTVGFSDELSYSLTYFLWVLSTQLFL